MSTCNQSDTRECQPYAAGDNAWVVRGVLTKKEAAALVAASDSHGRGCTSIAAECS
jgi:hypothetical protein